MSFSTQNDTINAWKEENEESSNRKTVEGRWQEMRKLYAQEADDADEEEEENWWIWWRSLLKLMSEKDNEGGGGSVPGRNNIIIMNGGVPWFDFEGGIN